MALKLASRVWIAGQVLQRYRFTLGMLLGLILTGMSTHTVQRPLVPSWRARLGVSPADLWNGRWWRLFTAPLVSDGVQIFWTAIVSTAFASSLTERHRGTWRTSQLFWGAHVLTMLIEAGIVRMLLRWQPWRWQRLFHTRDVGPSAGYFGLLGYLNAHLPAPWRSLSGASTTSVLLATFWRPYTAGADRDLRLLADIAHLVAFLLGWLFGFVIR